MVIVSMILLIASFAMVISRVSTLLVIQAETIQETIVRYSYEQYAYAAVSYAIASLSTDTKIQQKLAAQKKLLLVCDIWNNEHYEYIRADMVYTCLNDTIALDIGICRKDILLLRACASITMYEENAEKKYLCVAIETF